MDRRSLLGVPASQIRPFLGLLAALLLASLCGCDAGARQAARQRVPEEAARPPQESPPDDGLAPSEEPMDDKAEPEEAGTEPADVEPGAKLEGVECVRR